MVMHVNKNVLSDGSWFQKSDTIETPPAKLSVVSIGERNFSPLLGNSRRLVSSASKH